MATVAVTPVTFAQQAQALVCDGFTTEELSFSGATLINGANLQPGAVYEFTNIAPGINGQLEILGFFNGASLNAIDNDGLLTNNLNPELRPNPAGNGFVSFRISFINAATGLPEPLTISATQIDVDGDNAGLREFVEYENTFSQFTVDASTELVVNASGPSGASFDRFESTTTLTAPGIDPTATDNIVRVIYSNVTSYDYRIGTLGNGTTTRLNSTGFDCPALPNPVNTIPIMTADLVTDKALGAGSSSTPSVGDTVNFEITVTNNGPDSATNVTLTDSLPIGLTPTANNGTVTNGTFTAGTWDIPLLTSGATATLTLEGTVDAGQAGNVITNTLAAPATSDADDPSTVGDDLTESVTVMLLDADFSITKTNSPGTNGNIDQANDTLNSGDITTYTIEVTNNGPDTVSGAIITDIVGPGLTCAASDPVSITGDGVPAGSSTIADLTGAGVVLAALADGETTTLTYDCTVN